MKIVNFLTLFLLLLLFFACNRNNKTIEKQVIQDINRHIGDKNKHLLNIRKITNFNWDRLVVFNYAVSLETVNEAINSKYIHYREFTRPWIFLKDGKIVYYENNPSDVETLLNNQVLFEFPDSLKYQSYTPQNAIFRTEKKSFDHGYYYSLSQLEKP